MSMGKGSNGIQCIIYTALFVAIRETVISTNQRMVTIDTLFPMPIILGQDHNPTELLILKVLGFVIKTPNDVIIR